MYQEDTHHDFHRASQDCMYCHNRAGGDRVHGGASILWSICWSESEAEYEKEEGHICCCHDCWACSARWHVNQYDIIETTVVVHVRPWCTVSPTCYLGQWRLPRTTHGPGITRASLSAVKTEAPNWERAKHREIDICARVKALGRHTYRALFGFHYFTGT